MKYLSKKEIFNEVKKEYNLWLKGGCFGDENKQGTLWIDFIAYLKNKYGIKKPKGTKKQKSRARFTKWFMKHYGKAMTELRQK